MPDLAECIRLFHEAQANRPPGRPIRLIRVAMLETHRWDNHARHLTRTWRRGWGLREVQDCQELAETGERLGFERVGLVVETTEGLS